MEAVSAGGRTLTRRHWHSGMPCVDIDPHDIVYLLQALKCVADEFAIAMPELEEAGPEDIKGGWSCDFVIEGVLAGAYLNGRRCSIAVASEDKLERIFEALRRLAA